MDQHLTIVDHPLVQHKLTLMRDTATSTAVFRQLLREISQLLAYEVTRNLPMSTRQIETPLMTMDAPVIGGKKLALVSILRAGNGLLMGYLNWCPLHGWGLWAFTAMRRNAKPVGILFQKVPQGLKGDRLTNRIGPNVGHNGNSVGCGD